MICIPPIVCASALAMLPDASPCPPQMFAFLKDWVWLSPPKSGRLSQGSFNSINPSKNINIVNLTTIVSQTVTIVGVPSYTSGAH